MEMMLLHYHSPCDMSDCRILSKEASLAVIRFFARLLSQNEAFHT